MISCKHIRIFVGTLAILSAMAAGAQSAPEVIEAEKLIAGSPTASGQPVAGTSGATAELQEPIAPAVSLVTEVSKKESEIPVQLEPSKKASSENSLVFKVIFSLVLVGLMAGGAYIFIGRYRRANFGKGAATQIKVLTQHHLGPKKSLAIIRVAGESILIGITDQNINMIKSLSLLDEDLPEVSTSQFSAVLSNASQAAEESTSRIQSSAATKSNLEDGEEFSISGIKDFVSSRLKNMRSLE